MTTALTTTLPTALSTTLSNTLSAKLTTTLTTTLTSTLTSTLATKLSATLFAAPGIWALVRSLFRRFAAGAQPRRCAGQPAGLHKSLSDHPSHDRIAKSNAAKPNVAPNAKSNTIIRIANYAKPTEARCINGTKTPVLRVMRVMRVLEAGQAPSSVGRMVISGRMADVCAELDRLAAREATLR